MTRTTPDPDVLAAEADRLCGEADDAIFDDRDRDAGRLAGEALRLYREAARLSPEPRRGQIFWRAVELACATERYRAAVALIREACQGDPDFETYECLRAAWDDCGWVACRGEDPAPFPEPKPAGSLTLLDRKRPIPGQLTFLPEAD